MLHNPLPIRMTPRLARTLFEVALTIAIIVAVSMCTGCATVQAPTLERVDWSGEADTEIVTDQGSLRVAVSYVATYDEQLDEIVQCPVLELESSLYVALDIYGVPPDPAGVIPALCYAIHGPATLRPEKEPGRD